MDKSRWNFIQILCVYYSEGYRTEFLTCKLEYFKQLKFHLPPLKSNYFWLFYAANDWPGEDVKRIILKISFLEIICTFAHPQSTCIKLTLKVMLSLESCNDNARYQDAHSQFWLRLTNLAAASSNSQSIRNHACLFHHTSEPPFFSHLPRIQGRQFCHGKKPIHWIHLPLSPKHYDLRDRAQHVSH
jgi:hypothetical protein